MYWLEISVKTDGEAAEAVAEMLRPFAHQDGVVLEQLGDMDNLDPDALEPEVTVKIYVPEDRDTPELRQRIAEILYHMNRLYPVPPPIFVKLEEEDWANAWKIHYHPFRVGNKIWIQPSWLSAEEAQKSEDGDDRVKADDIILTLDPGMAFGTGLHPTTQMCMQALESGLAPGMSVLDVGTGSGILAVLAAKLGAQPIHGVDTDEVAVKSAGLNAAQNGVGEMISLAQGTLADVTQKEWDVVVVNILAPVIVLLLARDGLLGYVKRNGRLILSGIIDQQLPDVATAVTEAGGQILHEYHVRDWVGLVVGWA